jgi:universal stress protein family protein
VAERAFDRFVVVAPPKMLGYFRKAMSKRPAVIARRSGKGSYQSFTQRSRGPSWRSHRHLSSVMSDGALQRILVAVDLTLRGHRALRRGMQLALASGADLRLIYVCSEDFLSS